MKLLFSLSMLSLMLCNAFAFEDNNAPVQVRLVCMLKDEKMLRVFTEGQWPNEFNKTATVEIYKENDHHQMIIERATNVRVQLLELGHFSVQEYQVPKVKDMVLDLGRSGSLTLKISNPVGMYSLKSNLMSMNYPQEIQVLCMNNISTPRPAISVSN